MYRTEADEYCVEAFVEHHLDEIAPEYWKARSGTVRPPPAAVLGLLTLRSHWGGEDGIEHFDFTLPGDVTNYVLSVEFDQAGNIVDISMES